MMTRDRSRFSSGATQMNEPNHRFRILAVMAQGAPGALGEAWRSYVNLEDARAGARAARKDPRVLQVAIVDDHNGPLRLVEWIDSDRGEHDPARTSLPADT